MGDLRHYIHSLNPDVSLDGDGLDLEFNVNGKGRENSLPTKETHKNRVHLKKLKERRGIMQNLVKQITILHENIKLPLLSNGKHRKECPCDGCIWNRAEGRATALSNLLREVDDAD